MGRIASQITSLTIVYSTVYSDADQRKHQSSVSLAFVRGIHRHRRIPRTNGQYRGKCFHLMTSSCWAQIHLGATVLVVYGIFCYPRHFWLTPVKNHFKTGTADRKLSPVKGMLWSHFFITIVFFFRHNFRSDYLATNYGGLYRTGPWYDISYRNYHYKD